MCNSFLYSWIHHPPIFGMAAPFFLHPNCILHFRGFAIADIKIRKPSTFFLCYEGITANQLQRGNFQGQRDTVNDCHSASILVFQQTPRLGFSEQSAQHFPHLPHFYLCRKIEHWPGEEKRASTLDLFAISAECCFLQCFSVSQGPGSLYTEWRGFAGSQ